MQIHICILDVAGRQAYGHVPHSDRIQVIRVQLLQDINTVGVHLKDIRRIPTNLQNYTLTANNDICHTFSLNLFPIT
jgi:hypothetical protein